MNRTKVLPLILILAISCGVHKNFHSSDHASHAKVAIIGAGTVASRLFMDNLSSNIAGRLGKRNIGTSLIFLDNGWLGTQFDKSALDTLNYDAYIVLTPLGSENLVMNRSYRRFGFSPNSYKQDFSVEIYMQTDKTSPAWKGSLHVDLDPADEAKYNPISAYLLNYVPLY